MRGKTCTREKMHWERALFLKLFQTNNLSYHPGKLFCPILFLLQLNIKIPNKNQPTKKKMPREMHQVCLCHRFNDSLALLLSQATLHKRWMFPGTEQYQLSNAYTGSTQAWLKTLVGRYRDEISYFAAHSSLLIPYTQNHIHPTLLSTYCTSSSSLH